jgi:CheY-like chemotaxis protein
MTQKITPDIIVDVLQQRKPSKKGLKILILEDDSSRKNQFRKNMIGHVITVVSSTSACIEQLQETWDMLFIDHDLDGKVFVPSGPGTGWEVAEWLSKNPDKKPNKIIIHTLNNLGAQKMKELLPEAELLPFAWIMIW